MPGIAHRLLIRLRSRRRPVGVWAAGLLAVLYLYAAGGVVLFAAPLLWGWGLACGLSCATAGSTWLLQPGPGWTRRASIYLQLAGLVLLPVLFALLWYGMFVALSLSIVLLFGLWLGSRSAPLLTRLASRDRSRRPPMVARPSLPASAAYKPAEGASGRVSHVTHRTPQP